MDEISAINLQNIDIIIYLAGFTHDLRDTYEVGHLYRSFNVDPTVQLAELAVQNGVKPFVFVSSVKTGASGSTGQCMTEKEQGEPEGIYGKTKREAELKLLEIGCQSNMDVSIVRPSLVYRPDIKGNLQLRRSPTQNF